MAHCHIQRGSSCRSTTALPPRTLLERRHQTVTAPRARLHLSLERLHTHCIANTLHANTLHANTNPVFAGFQWLH